MSLRMLSPCERHACALCCYDTEMPLTESDIARLEALGHDRAAFVARDDEGRARLATRDAEAGGARPCHFLREGRCSAYDARPEGCRIYPLVLDLRGRLTKDEECPHGDEFPRDPGARRRIERILSTVDRERTDKARRHP